MDTTNLLTLVVGFLTLVGPLVVLLKNSESSKNRILFLMSVVTGPLWASSIVLFFETDSIEISHLAINLIYTVSVLIAILTFSFTKSFPYKTVTRIYEGVLLYLPAIYILYEVW